MLAPRQAASRDLRLLQRTSQGQKENAQDCGKREISEQPFHDGRATPLAAVLDADFEKAFLPPLSTFDHQFVTIIPTLLKFLLGRTDSVE
jgi:hypothetical protein